MKRSYKNFNNVKELESEKEVIKTNVSNLENHIELNNDDQENHKIKRLNIITSNKINDKNDEKSEDKIYLERSNKKKKIESLHNEVVELNKDTEEIEEVKIGIPKEINNSPASFQQRRNFIQIMIDSFKKKNPELKNPISKSIEEEYKVALAESSATYVGQMKKVIYKILNPEKFVIKKKITTDLDYLKILNDLIISKETLKKFGYIVDIPKAVPITDLKKCKRCNKEFFLNEQRKPTECHFHSGKIVRNHEKVRTFSCCGNSADGESEPCSFFKHHVYYLNTPEELHWVIPFKLTKEKFEKKKDCFKAVGIDCEMGYTTFGFELLRLTALDFFSGQEILDLFVKTHGDIIDFNTKWSGISEIKKDALTFDDLIDLLTEVIDKDTILIGHGLENDMNALRLIHEKIIDTAILYPKHKTCPTFRFSLKDLCFKYLSRNIQTGNHDSFEDSLAAIDILKYFITKNK